jgi:two-component system cell cycle sensor histidine kinase/response regulator CckA
LVSLNDAVTDVSHLVRRLLGEAVPLEIKLGRDLWSVMTDPGQFEQAVLNLAVNARDAMPQGGRLSIRTYNILPDECGIVGDGSLPVGDYVGFEIEDSGLGIAPSDLPKIFQPFFTTKDVGKGTGLGLSMVYGFVKQSGGYVFCRSRLGEGTCFVLVLPRHEESASIAMSDQTPASDIPHAAQPVADMTGAGTILLVEDEDAVRAFAARALTQRGYTVVEAASGVEALEQVAAHPDIDLIVSDVVMPEMDGPTMLRHLREQGANKPIIFVSGYAEDAFARNLPEGEDFGFLPKPFTLKQLVEAVKQALSGQKKAR